MTTELTRPAPLVTVQDAGPVREITIGSGTKRNALPTRGWRRITETLQEAAEDDTVRVIVIRGRGGMFCAGSDMTEWIDAELEQVEESFAQMESAFRAIEQCPLPVIAEIHGSAAGAGCQLALACDLRFLADSARIGMPIARLGIKTSPSFAARMVALVGPALTRKMLYTGTLLDAPTAVASGLADERAADAELSEFTAQTTAHIVEQPAAVVQAAKRAVSAALHPVRHATAHNDHNAVAPSDFRRGITEFLR